MSMSAVALVGHTITVESLEAAIARRVGHTAGEAAVVERTDGRLGTVPAVGSELDGPIEAAARAFADTYGARYVSV